MATKTLTGRLVRLSVEEPKATAEAYVRWNRDSEYFRLLDTGAPVPFSIKKMQEWIEKDQQKDPPPYFFFMIRTLADDRLIGLVGLDGDIMPHRDAFVGIGIGERELWGQGYGSDAMNLILGYAFRELNLRRVSLSTFEYNPRAIASYEKVGFVHEGRMRQYLHRDGRRWDMLFMGILREEWEARQAAAES